MPATQTDELPPHRQKIGPHNWPFNACVARPVGKAEIAANPAAQAALDKEWDRLRVKKVWDVGPSGVFEWRGVGHDKMGAVVRRTAQGTTGKSYLSASCAIAGAVIAG